MRGRKLVGAVAAAAVVVTTQMAAAGTAPGPEHGYVTDSMQLPTTNTQASSLGRDIDGNGTRDNRLGAFYAALAGHGLDLTVEQNTALQDGEIVMLHSLRAASLASATNATWQVLYGPPTPEPDLTGDGTFAVGTQRSSRLPAVIRNHRVSTAAGVVPVRLQAEGPVTLQLTRGRVFATCTRSRCTNARINGAVSQTQVDGTLLPAMVDAFNLWIRRDCPTDASSCAADSQGKTVLSLFDADLSATITQQEIRTSPLAGRFLKPDLDLVRPRGKDALSFGFGFTAVSARLAR